MVLPAGDALGEVFRQEERETSLRSGDCRHVDPSCSCGLEPGDGVGESRPRYDARVEHDFMPPGPDVPELLRRNRLVQKDLEVGACLQLGLGCACRDAAVPGQSGFQGVSVHAISLPGSVYRRGVSAGRLKETTCRWVKAAGELEESFGEAVRRSQRTRACLKPWGQAKVRSTTHQQTPRPLPRGVRCRAMTGSIRRAETWSR